MKKLIFLFILIISIYSCKKNATVDPCENTKCQNGGTCEDGSCKCPLGYTGKNCETNIADRLVGNYSVIDDGNYSWSISGSSQTYPCYHSFNINRSHTSEIKVDMRDGAGGFTISNFFGDGDNVYCVINAHISPSNNFIVYGPITIKDGACTNGYISYEGNNASGNPKGVISSDGKTIKISLNSDIMVGNEHRVNNFVSSLVKQ